MHPFKKYVNPYLGQLLESISMDKSFVKGEGCYLYDSEGNKYLDFIAAYGALPYGYNHKEIWDEIIKFHALMEPSFIQPSSLNAAGELAQKLIDIAPEGLRYVTFTNSGAETVEASIKLCRSATGRIGILSAKNSFHGKTLGALSATGKSYYQTPFKAPIEGFNHIEYGSLEALERELSKKPDYYAAFIIEPIQGEGGIVEPPKGYLKGVKEICDHYGVKLIVDEIQTGLGRTGARFACEEEGVTPDVLLLAKALGGGIIPIGACLCTEEVYNREFADRHSSTFAGNSLACRIGIKALDMLTDEVIQNVIEKGTLLKDSLLCLKNKYPNIIKTIRGRGLMLGIEFTTDREAFPGSLIGIMAEQGLLTPVISSYLLNVEKLRVAPTLNGTEVIRIEPPLIVNEEECKWAIRGVENLLRTLSEGNTAKLLSHLINAEIKDEAKVKVHNYTNKTEGFNLNPENQDERFAFLIHPLDIKNYSEFDQSLSSLGEKELKKLANLWNDLIEPFVFSKTKIKSKNGKTAYGEFIMVPKTAEELINLPKNQALNILRKAVKLAKDRGAKIVGLGAYTSVVSGGGLYLKNEGIPLTTGNSYTIVSAVEAVTSALTRLGVSQAQTTAAVVGAAGSLGRGISMLMSESVSKLILIGNPNNKSFSEKKLLKLAARIYKHLITMLQEGKKFEPGSIGDKLSNYKNIPNWDSTLDDFIEFALDMERSKNMIIITTEMDKILPTADIVISATNNVGKLINSDNLKSGAVVCDMSRPRNVSEDVLKNRPDVLVIDGGIIEVPGTPELGLNLGFDEGLAYACMSETMMLALDKHYKHTSLGSSGISLDNILLTRELANKHGFKIADFRSFDRPIPKERWETVITARKG
jgi:acetylornithine/succinyldiaminopimelate/putrescine aminotransferase/predicted amino acid dehydrogenase